jgi:iron complex outermembrane receptor protein
MNASTGFGCFNTRTFSGFINHKPGNWDYLISADYLDSDNDFEFTYDNQTRYNKADDRTVKRNNAQFDQTNILAKLGYDADDRLRVDFSHHWFSKDQGLPRFNNSPDADTSLDTEYHISTLKLTADDLTSYGINSSTTIDYTRKKEEYDDSRGAIGLGHQQLRYITEKYGCGTYLETISGSNVLSMTVDAHREKYVPENLLSGSDLDKSHRDQLSLGLQYRMALLQDQVMITPALRYIHLKDKLSPTEDFLDSSVNDRISNTDDYVLPQIGIDYRPLAWLTIKSNLGRYQRKPSFFELFGDRGFFTGNTDLTAEEGTNFDIGLECNWRIDSSPVHNLSFSAVYFRSDVDDLITRVYDARGIGRSENISGSLISGVEARGHMDFCKYFTLTANATFQDTENQSPTPVFDGKQLPGRFESSYLGRLEAKYAGFKVFLEYLTENEMYYDTANLLKAADKKEVNAGVSWLYRSVLISLEAKNMTDNQYEDFNGYPLPARSFTVKIKYTI